MSKIALCLFFASGASAALCLISSMAGDIGPAAILCLAAVLCGLACLKEK